MIDKIKKLNFIKLRKLEKLYGKDDKINYELRESEVNKRCDVMLGVSLLYLFIGILSLMVTLGSVYYISLITVGLVLLYKLYINACNLCAYKIKLYEVKYQTK